MYKGTIVYIKLLLAYILLLLLKISKLCKYLLTGKHEFERICESEYDIYEKTFQIDRWLERTNCQQIRDFLDQHFGAVATNINIRPRNSRIRECLQRIFSNYQQNEPRSESQGAKLVKSRKNKRKVRRQNPVESVHSDLTSALRTTTDDFIKILKKAKFVPALPPNTEECLRDVLYRIVFYRTNLVIMEQLATAKYNSAIKSHTDKLLSLWNNLVEADLGVKGRKAFPDELAVKIDNSMTIVSSRWSHIGFQGEDPGTDFRGMGLLGLLQLEYLSRRPKNLGIDLLKRSLNEKHSYPMAIVGINITYNLYNLFKDGSMKHLYYDNGDKVFRGRNRDTDLIETLNQVYTELFLRFDCFWHESKPENIFAFRELMEKFVDIIKMDLYNRSFNFKFIY